MRLSKLKGKMPESKSSKLAKSEPAFSEFDLDGEELADEEEMAGEEMGEMDDAELGEEMDAESELDSPLADLSDDDLLAEVKKRGLSLEEPGELDEEDEDEGVAYA